MLTLLFWMGFLSGVGVMIALAVLLLRMAVNRKNANGPDVFVVLDGEQILAFSNSKTHAVHAVTQLRDMGYGMKMVIVGYRPASELASLEAE